MSLSTSTCTEYLPEGSGIAEKTYPVTSPDNGEFTPPV